MKKEAVQIATHISFKVMLQTLIMLIGSRGMGVSKKQRGMTHADFLDFHQISIGLHGILQIHCFKF